MNQHNGSKSNQQLTIGVPSTPSEPAEVTVIPSNNNGSASTATNNTKFDQPVILRQSHVWSRAILWTIVIMTVASIFGAWVAKIEQAVPAQGKLEPEGSVQEIQAPVSGVVTQIHVKDGQHVEKGQLLLSLDPTAPRAQLASLSKVRATLIKENQFYRSVLRNSTPSDVSGLQLPIEITSLAESRKALIAENQLYGIQMSGNVQGISLSPEQRVRLISALSELNSRVAATALEVEQNKKQLEVNKVKLANSKNILDVEQQIFDKLKPLAEVGAVAQLQYLKQQQQVQSSEAEVKQLTSEQSGLQVKINQAQQQLANTIALTQKDLTDRMADNNKKIADIDGQLNRNIVENEKKIAEIDSQISQAKLTLDYQELRAPSSGTVFDLKPSAPGFVTNTTEPILKIVPTDSLVAKVYLTNKDIGFVREGMPVDVRIDSFPFSEFGDIKGELIWIGSDALPPEQIRPYYSFPAKVKLNQQYLRVNDRKISLQSGMSISTNIKVRDRTVLSIFTDLFYKKTDSLKTVR
ncbi:MAG TPA: HlyD family efflux transporter periplasmic adaptor subunit [Coleofasciculaceae cyanobacterium]